MLNRVVSILAVLVIAAVARGQQLPNGQPAQPSSQGKMLEIYQIDLIPSGQAFALSKPRLEGDVYVFTAWPDRTTARLSKAKVKKITKRTKDPNEEFVYQIDLVPTGRMIARENPVLKGGTWVFHTWRDGNLMSLRQADVQKITKVTGMSAFKIQQELRGAERIGNLPMEGGGTVRVIPSESAQPAPASADPNNQSQGNWSYQGQPGVSDAYAPPSAVVSSPGDVPKAAPTPQH